ncbi:short-chain dehydrogenase/reductase [Xylariales sp. AK1849]|nr:short-chain dehydrogenase/reductase [Xylariales sp. AK1849]
MPQKTVLITGCGPNGIGHALATEFQLLGHRVIASGLNESLLAPLADMGMETVPMDVTSQDSIDSALSFVSKLTHGRLDILINNAGLMHIMPFADTAVADARRVFEVNVLGLFAVTQAFLPLLLATEGGQSIVAILGSVNAVFCPPFFSVYNASKAAVEAMGKTIRRELAPLGVRVVTLKTGSVRTGLFANAPETRLPEGSLYEPVRQWVEGRKMLEQGRFVKADEYARRVVSELLRPSVRHVVWQGGLATVAWLMSWFGWEGMLDPAMIRGNGLDKVKRQ